MEDSALLKLGVVRRNYVLEFGHGEAMMRAVRIDVGLAFLFKSSIGEELENRTLKIIPLKDFKIEVTIYLIKRSGKYFSSFQSKLFAKLRGSAAPFAGSRQFNEAGLLQWARGRSTRTSHNPRYCRHRFPPEGAKRPGHVWLYHFAEIGRAK